MKDRDDGQNHKIRRTVKAEAEIRSRRTKEQGTGPLTEAEKAGFTRFEDRSSEFAAVCPVNSVFCLRR